MVLTYLSGRGSIHYNFEDERDMKTYERTFINPLLALAFTDGVSFSNPNYICKRPERKGETKWVVEIEEYEENETITKDPVMSSVVEKTMMEIAIQQPSNKPRIVDEDPAKNFSRTTSSEHKHRKFVPPDKVIDALASSLPPPKKIKVAGEVEEDTVSVPLSVGENMDEAAKQSIDQWLKDRVVENEIDVNDSDIIDMRDLNDDNESMPLVGLGGLSTWPCGACIGCYSNDSCMEQVNAGCLAQNMVANLIK